MIALVGSWLLERGDAVDADLDVVASLEESGLAMDGAGEPAAG